MAHFVLQCLDASDAKATRAVLRAAHVAHVRGSGHTRIAGPLLDEFGEINGSILIIEAEDLEAAEAFAAADPYSKAGVYKTVDIRPFRLTFVSV